MEYLRRVLSQPVVSLSEIVEYDPSAVSSPSRQHDGRTGVGLWRHPRAVERIRHQEHRYQANDHSRHLVMAEIIRAHHKGKNSKCLLF